MEAYPLQWPEGWPRAANRHRAKFSRAGGGWSTNPVTGGNSYDGKKPLTISQGTDRVLAEMGRFRVDRDTVVISSNLKLRRDGLPYSDQRAPDDPGVAVYWTNRKGERKVMAIDIYDRIADNLAAVAATLDAMRSIERHGGAQILERAFTGFTALADRPHWATTLGVSPKASRPDIEAAFRKLAAQHHPDRGGSHDRMAEITAAREQALKEVVL